MCLDALASDADIVLTEFAMSDRHFYGLDEAPYEILSLAARANNAVHLDVVFWGAFFRPDSARLSHLNVSRHHGIATVDLQAIALPMVSTGKWARPNITSHIHFPKTKIHRLTADLVLSHVCDLVMEWHARKVSLSAVPIPAPLTLHTPPPRPTRCQCASHRSRR